MHVVGKNQSDFLYPVYCLSYFKFSNVIEPKCNNVTVYLAIIKLWCMRYNEIDRVKVNIQRGKEPLRKTLLWFFSWVNNVRN